MKRFICAIAFLCLVFSCTKPEGQSVPSDKEPTPKEDVISLISSTGITISADGGTAEVSFNASGAWSVEISETWLKASPSKGTGKGSVVLTAEANPSTESDRKAEVRLTCGSASAKVTVVQEKAKDLYQPVVIYSENMDASPTYSGWMSESTWNNATGEGAADVSYGSFNARINNDNYGSNGSNGTYSGASGACYGRLQQASSGNFGYLIIFGISTCGYRDFSLSFGAAQGPDVMKVELSPDGDKWTEIQYSFGENYNRWGIAKANFSVGAAVTTLYIRFTLIGAREVARYGANFDDIRLETAKDPSDVVIGDDGNTGSWPYAELPVRQNNPDYYYNTLYTHTVLSGKSVRNYSFCYDTRRHNPLWVAFPMHGIYAEGSGRSKDENGNDPWTKYPGLTIDQQSIIWDVAGDGHQFWSYTSLINNYAFFWTKGHLCMSSSRAGASQEINLQTFYPVNIAPQSGKPFSDIWAKTEDLHWQRGTQVCADTLYVVAGCHYANDDNIEYDACYSSVRCSYSKPCIVPTHQYKLFLRTRDGYTGKPVQACSADELKAIGFWMDSVLPAEASEDLSSYAMSVADIEKITGITFFPDIPAAVKKQCNPSDWGL